MHNAKKIGFIIVLLQSITIFTMDNHKAKVTNDSIYHALLDTITEKNEKIFKQTIRKYPAIINYASADQLPPLHYILHYCGLKHHPLSSKFLRIALESGADPNITNRNGERPLHIASTVNHINILLAFKADPNKKDNRGRTPLLSQIFNSSFRRPINSFNENHYNVDPIITSLILADTDINTPDDEGITPLHMAIGTINLPIIKLLLKCKAHFRPLFICQKKVSFMKKYTSPSEMIRRTASVRNILEPYFQKYLSLILYSNDKDKVIEFMNDYSWINYVINQTSLFSWTEKNCRSKNGNLLHSVHTFYQCLNKALFKADTQETERLLKAGARINIGRKGHYKTAVLSEALITGNHEKAALLLQHGALVTQFILDDPIVNENLQDLLQEKYDEQKCIICWQHPEDMEDIPCINRHPDYFMCKTCYSKIAAENNQCPLRCGSLGKYDTEFGKYRKNVKQKPQ